MKKINWHREPDGRVRIAEKGLGGKRWPRAKCSVFDTYSNDQVEAWVQNYNMALPSSRPITF